MEWDYAAVRDLSSTQSERGRDEEREKGWTLSCSRRQGGSQTSTKRSGASAQPFPSYLGRQGERLL